MDYGSRPPSANPRGKATCTIRSNKERYTLSQSHIAPPSQPQTVQPHTALSDLGFWKIDIRPGMRA
jgi:hypothetical protein